MNGTFLTFYKKCKKIFFKRKIQKTWYQIYYGQIINYW